MLLSIVRLAVLPLCFLSLVCLLLRLDIDLERDPTIRTLLHVFQLFREELSRNAAILGSRTCGLTLNNSTCWQVLELDSRRSFVLCSSKHQSGYHMMRQADLTIFCPPGPLPFKKASSMSASSMAGLGGSCFACVIAPPKRLTNTGKGLLKASAGDLGIV